MIAARNRAMTAVVMLTLGSVTARTQEFPGREKLLAQSAEFRREVIQVADGVYVAVGPAIARRILVGFFIVTACCAACAVSQRKRQ